MLALMSSSYAFENEVTGAWNNMWTCRPRAPLSRFSRLFCDLPTGVGMGAWMTNHLTAERSAPKDLPF